MDERTAEQISISIERIHRHIKMVRQDLVDMETLLDGEMELLRQAYERKAKGERDE